MKHVLQTIFVCVALLGVTAPTPVSADVAVLISITDAAITVHRVERTESTDSFAQEHSDAIIKERALPTSDATKGNSANSLVVEWFDASGKMVHREAQPDPRFVHAPGGGDVILPEALVLIRAPNSAVEMRVRPRGFVNFTVFTV